MTDFDPYEVLLDLIERVNRVEQAHNNLAHAYERSERELNQALHLLQQLQKRHLALSATVYSSKQ